MRKTPILFAVLAIACLLPTAARGNPISIMNVGYGTVTSYMGYFDLLRLVIPPLLLELALLLFFTHKWGRNPWATAGAFVGLHAITWPLTIFTAEISQQLFIDCIKNPNGSYMQPHFFGIPFTGASFSEIVPILAEAAFWFWWFRKAPVRPTFSRCLWISFVVNMASYVAGILMARKVLYGL